MAKNKNPRDYETGYGKPPKQAQFKRGKSGNPKGRPKGTRNLKSDLSEELQELVSLREGGRDQRISKQRALIKSLMAQAVQGNTKAADTILKLMDKLLTPEEAPEPERPLTDGEEAILENLETRVLRRAAARQRRQHSQPAVDLTPENLESTKSSKIGESK